MEGGIQKYTGDNNKPKKPSSKSRSKKGQIKDQNSELTTYNSVAETEDDYQSGELPQTQQESRKSERPKKKKSTEDLDKHHNQRSSSTPYNPVKMNGTARKHH